MDKYKSVMKAIGNYKDFDKHKYKLSHNEFDIIYTILKFRITDKTRKLYNRMKSGDRDWFTINQEEALMIYKMLKDYLSI